MRNRLLKITLSLAIAIMFLWLAFKNVDLKELWGQITEVRLYWLLPFTLVMAVTHYFRAERWLLLISDVKKQPHRSTLYAGVMVGYMLNNIFPRLGEISRPVYVARKMGISTGNLFGTIVLERVIDIVFLIGFLIFISFYVVQDPQVISQIFGTEAWTTSAYFIVPAGIILLVFFAWAGYRMLVYLDNHNSVTNPLLLKVVDFGKMFWSGLISIRKVGNWPLFLLYTMGIWIGYVAMAYLPFWMLDLHQVYDLGFIEAMIVTIISAVGITIPTPGGLGTYHLFVQQSMWLLFSVPLVTALTYATITHAATILIVYVIGAGALWFDKYYTLKSEV